jgi:putative ABC transport system permease protein
VDAGFDPERVLTFQIPLTGERYAESPAVAAFYTDVSARVASLPGVSGVTGATQLPLSGSRDQSGITIQGRTYENPAAAPTADRYSVRPDYFQVMGIPLLKGRVFDRDGVGTPPVAIVGKTMADELWPNQDPIGQRIRVAGGDDNPFRTVVGVVGDVKHDGLHLPVTPQVYIPHGQNHYPEPFLMMLVRTDVPDAVSLAPSIREMVRAVDPLQPVTDMESYESMVASSVATRRFTLLLLALFAITALMLAVVGLYGALSYVVSQRQREIGVRVALGAGAREISRLVLRQGMTPTAVGLVAGLAASVIGARIIESMLYGTSPRDAVTFITVFALVALSALAACLIPARKAAATDPAVTLKAE